MKPFAFTEPLRGIIPPMATPLRDQDELDYDGLARLIEHLLAGGVGGLFVLGTTGEGPSLSYRLRYELVERTCELVAGRVPVLVGVTDTCRVESVGLARFARECGADAMVAAPPYYFPLSQTELATHFERLAEESPLPLILYNIPVCTHIAVGLEVVKDCLRLPRVVGIKDSSGDLEYFGQLLELRRQRPAWTVLIGPEHLTAAAVRMGGDGGVNGGSNLHPRLFVELFAAAAAGDAPRTAALQEQVVRLGAIYEHGTASSAVVAAIKCGLSLLGICDDCPAEPLHSLGRVQHQAVAACLSGLGLLLGRGRAEPAVSSRRLRLGDQPNQA